MCRSIWWSCSMWRSCIIRERLVPNVRKTFTYIRSDSISNFVSFTIIGNDSKSRKLGSRWTGVEKCAAPYGVPGIHVISSHCIISGDEKKIHFDPLKKGKSRGSYSQTSMTTTPNIYETHDVCLVRSSWCCETWAAQTLQNHYRGSLSKTID